MLHQFKYVHKALRVHMQISATPKQPIHELCFLFGSVSKLVHANVCTLYTNTHTHARTLFTITEGL